MKNIHRISIIAALILLIHGLALTKALAQASGGPPPPPPAHGQQNNVPGGGAPVGEGLLILTVLAGAWGVKKFRNYRKISNQVRM